MFIQHKVRPESSTQSTLSLSVEYLTY